MGKQTKDQLKLHRNYKLRREFTEVVHKLGKTSSHLLEKCFSHCLINYKDQHMCQIHTVEIDPSPEQVNRTPLFATITVCKAKYIWILWEVWVFGGA